MTSPIATLILMILGWLAMAVAMLWGMLRIARRHHPANTLREERPAPSRHYFNFRRHAGQH